MDTICDKCDNCLIRTYFKDSKTSTCLIDKAIVKDYVGAFIPITNCSKYIPIEK